MALIFDRAYKIVHELENLVEERQEIDIKAYAAQMADIFGELYVQAMVQAMHETLKELYQGDVTQMRADVEKLQLGEVSQNTRKATAKTLMDIYRELLDEPS